MSSMGNRKLATTATSAATNVLTTYRSTTVFIDPAARAFASALITRKNTRIGATPFSADTNSVPSSSTTSMFGTATPSTPPITSPMTMRFTRLTEFHAWTTFLIPMMRSFPVESHHSSRKRARARKAFGRRFSFPPFLVSWSLRAFGRDATRAGVAELADAPDLGSGGETREGSSPFARTIKIRRGALRPMREAKAAHPFPMHAFVKLNASLDPHTLDKSVHEQKKARSFGVRAS